MIFRILGVLPFAVSTFAAVPYYVHQKAYTVNPDGSRHLDSEHIYARRSDGSTFEQAQSFDTGGKLVNRGRHMALTGGLVVDTDDVAGLMSAMRLPDDSQRDAAQWDPSSKCTKTFGGRSVGPEWKIAGEDYQGHGVFKLTNDGPASRTVIWRARDLGCAVLKETLELTGNPGRAEIVADDIRTGEPPADLFIVPTKLKNVSPTERIKGNRSNTNGLVPVAVREQDELYRKYKTGLPQR